MRKHHIFRLLLTIGLICIMSTALAESCAVCGNDTGRDSYLCASCMLRLLQGEHVASPLEITEAVRNDDGTVTITWTDEEGNAPYDVYYELLESAPTPFGWTAASGTSETSCTFTRLVPGVSYLFTLEDSRGNKAEYIYYAPVPQTDTEIGATIRVKPRTYDGKQYKDRVYISPDKAVREGAEEYGLYVRVNYSPLKKNRTYNFLLVVEAPGGYSEVVYSGTLMLHHGRSHLPVWGYVPLADYFDILDEYYGGVPSGDYIVTLYFNGAKVHSDTVPVHE